VYDIFMDEEHVPSSIIYWSSYRLPILLGIVSILCIGISFFLLFKSFQTSEPVQFSHTESSDSAVVKRILIVDIEGAVKNPGVYELEEGSRIEDLIQKAGGLNDKADEAYIQKTINRASVLLDGAKLYIPKKGEVLSSSSENRSNTTSASQPFVNINTASTKELDSLSGIGEVTANKIIAGRPYQTLEELVTRKILSQSVFEKIKGQLAL
jgi:competence protein ComEA